MARNPRRLMRRHRPGGSFVHNNNVCHNPSFTCCHHRQVCSTLCFPSHLLTGLSWGLKWAGDLARLRRSSQRRMPALTDPRRQSVDVFARSLQTGNISHRHVSIMLNGDNSAEHVFLKDTNIEQWNLKSSEAVCRVFEIPIDFKREPVKEISV